MKVLAREKERGRGGGRGGGGRGGGGREKYVIDKRTTDSHVLHYLATRGRGYLKYFIG